LKNDKNKVNKLGHKFVNDKKQWTFL